LAVLLNQTVLPRHHPGPDAYFLAGRHDHTVIGGSGGNYRNPIPLNNGAFLQLQVSLHLLPSRDDERVRLWKVLQSRFQYQLDGAPGMSNRWVFRYDYLREPDHLENRPVRPYTHLNLRGAVEEADTVGHLPGRWEGIHFPTHRVSIESCLRLLLTDFRVPANSPEEVWQPLLWESERMFLEIAHSQSA
jgi:hypothetical protein